MSDEEIDTDGTYNQTCPHCGFVYFVDTDAYGYYDGDSVHGGRKLCTECGGWFIWYFEIVPSFWTTKVDWVKEWKNYNRQQTQIAELKMLNGNEGR